MTEVFKPEVGSTLFVSFLGSLPFVTIVKGYSIQSDNQIEFFEYIRRDGQTDSAKLEDAKFFPSAPINSNFVYSINAKCYDYEDHWNVEGIAYFFEPQSAFNYIRDVKDGILPTLVSDVTEYFVSVIQLDQSSLLCDFSEDIISANNILFYRYKDIIKNNEIQCCGDIDKEYLLKFCDTAVNTTIQESKHSRWLGFLQGILFYLGLINLQTERDLTRRIYQNIYTRYGIIQETIDVKSI